MTADDDAERGREAQQRSGTDEAWATQLGPFYNEQTVQQLLAGGGAADSPTSRTEWALLALTTGSGQVVYPASSSRLAHRCRV